MRRGLVALCAALLAWGTAAVAQPGGSSRLRPPEQAACTRDHLTAYAGKVLRYSRHPGAAGHTVLQIRTDAGTTESVRIDHPGQADGSRWFLLAGQPFAPGDLARIEAGRDRLHPGWRVVAWVCDDGHPPLVDWTPPPR